MPEGGHFPIILACVRPGVAEPSADRDRPWPTKMIIQSFADVAKVFGAYWFALIVSVSAVALLIYAGDTDSQVGRSMS
jgi:hypothetical protein